MDDAKYLREGEYLQSLAQSAGWELMEGYIQDQIAARVKDLERKNFESLAQVARIQGEIAGLRAPLTFLQDRLRRFSQALQKGEK
jgi:hypothetical protein